MNILARLEIKLLFIRLGVTSFIHYKRREISLKPQSVE